MDYLPLFVRKHILVPYVPSQVTARKFFALVSQRNAQIIVNCCIVAKAFASHNDCPGPTKKENAVNNVGVTSSSVGSEWILAGYAP